MTGLKLPSSIGKFRNIPVTLYGTGASSDVVFRAGQLGAVRFLEYPFRIEEQLIPTIEDALARPDGSACAATRHGAEHLTGISTSMRQIREAIRHLASPLEPVWSRSHQETRR
jgi:DNA-binding NtrC family response regulator